jgi:hypothetical protein
MITASEEVSSGESCSSRCGRARNSLYDGITIAHLIDSVDLIESVEVEKGFIYKDLQH